MGGIEVKDLVFTYPGTSSETLRGVDLTVGEGEFLSLIGPSGCGKSTLLRLLAGLERPESGSLFCGGVPITGPGSDRGVVFQSPALFPWMTARDNVSFDIRKSEHLLSRAEARSRAEEALCRVGLADSMSMLPNQLSGGMQQRVAIARVLGMGCPTLLLDEPFSALDPLTRSQLQDELVSLQSKLHKTIVFVTHDMDEAVKIADRICILQGGRILQYDTPENILKNPAHGFVSEFVGSKRIWSSPQLIRAKDIMITSPKTTYPYVPMFKGLEKMRIDKVDSLIVIDEDNHLLGIVRARSILNSADKSLPVETVMTPARVTADTEENIVSLLEKINGLNISNIPVTDRDNRLAGLITNSSLVTTMSHQFIGVKGGAGA